MQSKKKATMITLIVAVLNSVVIAVFNLIYNNLIIRNYGSDVSGLISTLSQFVSMFSILEGGFTTAAIVAVYEPCVNKDYDKLNDVIYTTKKVYIKIGSIMTIIVSMCGGIYLQLLESPLGFFRTYTLLFITLLSTTLSLCFQSRYNVLFQGTNHEYIQLIIGLSSKTIVWIFSIIMIFNHENIVDVYALNILGFLINIFLSKKVEKKYFGYITNSGNYNTKLIKGTTDVLFQKIANTIFVSTDLVLISVGVGLAATSVYNLYQQIYRVIFNFLVSIVQAPFHSFGHLIEEGNKKRIEEYFNLYFKITLLCASILLGVTGSMILSFIRIYTVGITDINYIRNELALLFFLQFFVQIVNRPFGTILNVSGNFNKQNLQCGIAAVVNIVFSLLLMRKWGSSGVILGSFIGTCIILFANMYQCRVFLARIKRMVVEILVNMVVILCVLQISYKYLNYAENYLYWALLATLVFFAECVIVLSINFMLDYKNMYLLFSRIKRILSRKI